MDGFNINFWPAGDRCIGCDKKINPKTDRQELTWDENNVCRRRCGACINKLNNTR